MHEETHEGGVARAAARSPRETAGELQQLRAELAKWRDRVPKLAAALRQRTEELESLKRWTSTQHAVGAAPDPAVAGDAGIRVRDELIGELEAKLEALDQNLRSARGELHARSLEVTDLQDNVRSWKQKWQALTQALDAQAQELAEIREERDSLSERNEKLYETTELANRQIETLADNLAELRQKLREGADLEVDAGRASEEIRCLTDRVASLSEQVQDLESYAQTLCVSAMNGVRDGVAERQRLEEQADAAEERAAQAESARLEAQARQQRLELQLKERSQLVLELEQRASRQDTLAGTLEQEKQGLQEALLRAEREARENAEHVTQLDDRLERQKVLLTNLEQELAEALGACGGVSTPPSEELAAREAEIASLRRKVRTLETMVREQAAEANSGRWRRECAGTQGLESSDGQTVLVLSQQLEAARAQNSSLLERVRDLEEELTHVRMQPGGDDLTRIHGVGPKLAQQLNDMGIYRLEQIAELDAEGLADQSHMLYAHKGRILRDGWIEQAARLIRH